MVHTQDGDAIGALRLGRGCQGVCRSCFDGSIQKAWECSFR